MPPFISLISVVVVGGGGMCVCVPEYINTIYLDCIKLLYDFRTDHWVQDNQLVLFPGENVPHALSIL